LYNTCHLLVETYFKISDLGKNDDYAKFSSLVDNNNLKISACDKLHSQMLHFSHNHPYYVK